MGNSGKRVHLPLLCACWWVCVVTDSRPFRCRWVLETMQVKRNQVHGEDALVKGCGGRENQLQVSSFTKFTTGQDLSLFYHQGASHSHLWPLSPFSLRDPFLSALTNLSSNA